MPVFRSIFVTDSRLKNCCVITLREFFKLSLNRSLFTGERFKAVPMVIVQSKMQKLAWNWFSWRSKMVQFLQFSEFHQVVVWHLFHSIIPWLFQVPILEIMFRIRKGKNCLKTILEHKPSNMTHCLSCFWLVKKNRIHKGRVCTPANRQSTGFSFS